MTSTIAFNGVAGRVELEIVRKGGVDWLECVARTELEDGRYTALIQSDLEIRDLDRFGTELQTLLDELDGEARLEHFEGQFVVRISLRRGRGTITGFIREPISANLEFEFDTDQSYLQQTLTDVRHALERFA